MTKFAINPPGMSAHPSLSHAIVVQSKRTIYVAGQLPQNQDGSIFAPFDIDAQIEKVWAQIDLILETAGATRDDIARVTAYTTDQAYCRRIVEAREKRFAGAIPPSSVLIVVAALAQQGAVVEIDAVAEIES